MSKVYTVVALPCAVTKTVTCHLLDVDGNKVGIITTPWTDSSTSELVGMVNKLGTLPGHMWYTPSIVLTTELHSLGVGVTLDTICHKEVA